jgi:N-acetyl-gamma-glutamylphosphate reductase
MDNNPLVCADEASVPGPVSTLALIALGPLVRASLLKAEPTILSNALEDQASIERFLKGMGWNQGVVVAHEDQDLEGVLAATTIAEIETLPRLEDVDDLYAEAYGPSFYVRRDGDSAWHIQLVKGHPHAVFRLRITAGVEASLLTVQVMADKQGKCGAAQIVHAMNVMAGYEESLGV